MNNRTLPILAAAVVVLGGLGLWLAQSRQGQTDVVSANQPLVEGLAGGLNEVSGLRIEGAGNALVVDLQRTDKGWVAANKGGFPADFSKVREYLLKLSESRLREAKTANPERHARLGVEDLANGDAKGVGVKLDGLAKPVQLIVGTFNANSGQGYFVRHGDQAQTWLASGNIRPDTNLQQWLSSEIVNLGSPRIRSVEITPPSGAKVRIEKTDPAAPDYTVLDLPRGRELSSPSIGNGISTLFDNLRLEDVFPAADAQPDPDALYKAQYLTQEGVQLTVDGWEAGDKAHVRIHAALDPARSEAWLIEQQSEAEAAHQATAAAAAAGGEDAASTAATPFDAEAFRAGKLSGLQQEVDAINARTDGWTFAIPSWKYANVKKSMEDLLKPRDGK